MNEKGFTTIELMLSFTLLMIIILSVFNTIMNYRHKQQIEAIKNDMLVFKNTVTKSIADDVIKSKIVIDATSCGTNCSTIKFSDDTSKNLIIDPVKLLITYGEEKYFIKHKDTSSLITNEVYLKIVPILNDTRRLLVIDIPILNTNLDDEVGIHIVANIRG